MKRITSEDLALFFGVLIMYVTLYLLNNNIQHFPVWTVPKSLFDQIVSFGPEWIYVYLTAYLLPFVMFFSLSRYNLHRSFVEHFFLLTSIVNLIFFFSPSTIIRPEYSLVELDELTRLAFDLLFSADKPFNCFPSTHVSTSLIAAFVVRERPRLFSALLAMALLISYSALAIGQHYLFDALGGVLAALVATWLHPYLFESQRDFLGSPTR